MNNLKFYFIITKLFLKGWKISNIQKVIDDYKLKTIILEFRTNALCFGFDTSNYSDGELLKSANVASKEISKFGLTADEATKALNTLSKSMIQFKPEFN